jgi:hypothetical protein
MADDELDIPESNREIALHLRSIRTNMANMNTRLDNLENTIQTRRFRLQDVMLSSLVFPLVGGMILFLMTKGLG